LRADHVKAMVFIAALFALLPAAAHGASGDTSTIGGRLSGRTLTFTVKANTAQNGAPPRAQGD